MLAQKNRVFLAINVFHEPESYIAAVYIDKQEAVLLEMLPFNSQTHEMFSKVVRDKLESLVPGRVQYYKEFPRCSLVGDFVSIFVCCAA